MNASQWVVTLLGAVTVLMIVWFFWLKKEAGVAAAVTTSGYQEATILVQDGYNPAVVRVTRGQPVRLTFRREETSACSESVVLGAFDRYATLPQGQLVPVEFVPRETGRFPFTCSMGMLRGEIVVGEPGAEGGATR